MVRPRIRELERVDTAPPSKGISEGFEGYRPAGTTLEGAHGSEQVREQRETPNGKEAAKILFPEEQEQEFEGITQEVIQRIHKDSFRIFGNPDDTLSGDILTAQVYLIAFIG